VRGFRRLPLHLCPGFGKVFELFHPPAYFSIVSSVFEEKEHSQGTEKHEAEVRTRARAFFNCIGAVKDDAFVKSPVHPSIPQGERVEPTVTSDIPFVVRYRTMNGRATADFLRTHQGCVYEKGDENRSKSQKN
jgi:hypothetical protein